jgi:hypothetical protein
MSATPVDPAEQAPTASTTDLLLAIARRLAAVVAVFLLLWGACLQPLQHAEIDLDPSWRMMLSYALEHRLQFGPEFIFTYGPLGYLMGTTYAGIHYWSHVLWQAGIAAVFAGLFMAAARPLGGGSKLVFYAFVLGLASTYHDMIYVASILLVAMGRLRDPRPEASAAPLLAGGFLAVLSLLKFTHLLLAAFAVAVLVVHDLLAGRRARAAWLGGGFAGTFLLLWVALGQNLLHLPVYLRLSLEISLGYEAMMLDPVPAQLTAGLVAFGALVVYALLHLAAEPDKRRALAACLLLGASTYLNWKHGFVRADGHVVGFYIHAVLVAALFPHLLADGPRWRLARGAVLAVAAGAGLVGTHLTFPQLLPHALAGFNERWLRHVTWFAEARSGRALYEERWRQQADRYHLPRTAALLPANGTVDVLAHFQGLALLNGFTLSPRPAFQGYTAYTPALIRRNLAHYQSDRAPDIVLQRFRTIDERFPTLDDAPLLLQLLRDYEFALEDGGNLVWKRLPVEARRRDFEPDPVVDHAVGFGDDVPLLDLTARDVWAEIHVRPSLLGRIRKFFYKLPIVTLVVTDTTGRTERYRLVPGMASEGFLLNPLLRDQYDLLRLLLARETPRLTSLRVEVPAGTGRFFRRDVHVALAVLPPRPRVRGSIDEALFADAGGFRNFPVAYSAHAEPGPATVAGEPAVLVHAPSELVFRFRAGTTTVRGRFGFPETAYPPAGHTDGAEFSVIWQSATERRVLLRRLLDPAGNPDDRGLIPFELDTSGLGDGLLLLLAHPGPNDNYAYDWTCWAGIEFLPVIAEDHTGVAAASDHLFVRYGRFRSFPFSTRSHTPLAPAVIRGFSMIQAHAPGELAFEVRPEDRAAVGYFGIQETAYTGGGATDGATFSVVLRTPDGDTTLFQRHLDPLRVPEDRGVHAFHVTLPPRAGGAAATLLLRTDPGPAGDLSWDWTCWSDIAIGDPSPLPPPALRPAAGDLAAPPAADAPAEIAAALFREHGQFAALPARVAALGVPGPARLDDQPAVQVHPPSELVFTVPAGATALRAQFGFQRGAYTGDERTDGATFLVEARTPAGDTRELFRRFLAPATVPADRGAQELRLDLSDLAERDGAAVELVLRTDPGPAGDLTFDWTVWRAVAFEGAVAPSTPEPATIPFALTTPPAPPAVTRSLPIAETELRRYGFRIFPTEVTAFAPPVAAELFGTPVLGVHAPSVMVFPFEPGPGARRLVGRFGIQEGAYSGVHTTDGADFIVEWRGPRGETRELWRRTLFPATAFDDRGLISFEVDLAGLDAGELVLRTGPGPSGNNSTDWTCWQGIELR